MQLDALALNNVLDILSVGRTDMTSYVQTAFPWIRPKSTMQRLIEAYKKQFSDKKA